MNQSPNGSRLARQQTIQLGLYALKKAVVADLESLAQDIGDLLLEHVKTDYVRPLTGKGFTNRTFRLRNSIRATVAFNARSVTIQMRASAINPITKQQYAADVEEIKGGKYAYLRPTLNDLMPRIHTMLLYRMSVTNTVSQANPGISRIQELIAKGKAIEARGGSR